MRQFSVIIADDHQLVRNSIRRIVEASPHFVVVGEAEDGMSAVAEVRSRRPDLVILDIAMPQSTGVEAIEEIRRWSPDTKIAVVTGMTAKRLLTLVYQSGVEGIFMKAGDPSGWAEDLKAICDGERRIPDTVLQLAEEPSADEELTRRERQILFRIARGESNATIGEHLNISANTVDRHRTKIMRKLGVHSATELVARAFRDGLLESEDHR
ncbi:MAG: response regulator transcription factor [Parvularculaceae bacterium]|nr:response regulator transcription factor [Parvularculaceae bacterium]